MQKLCAAQQRDGMHLKKQYGPRRQSLQRARAHSVYKRTCIHAKSNAAQDHNCKDKTYARAPQQYNIIYIVGDLRVQTNMHRARNVAVQPFLGSARSGSLTREARNMCVCVSMCGAARQHEHASLDAVTACVCARARRV